MIILKALGRAWDITDYVNRPYQFNDNIAGLNNTGKIELVGMKPDELEGIDLSKRIPINAIVEIERHNGLTKYFVETPIVERKGDLYEHTLMLIEPRVINENRPIPDFSITQPIRDVDIYISEASRVLNNSIVGDASGVNINNINFETSQVSNDDGVLENRIANVAGDYIINFNVNLNRIENALPYSVKITGQLYINDTLEKEYIFVDYHDIITSLEVIGVRAIEEVISLQVNDEVKFKIKVENAFDEQPYITLLSGNLVIDKKLDVEADLIYMDDVVKKIIKLFNITGKDEYVLDETSKARLGTILAYEEMHTEATIKTALERVASYVKAKVYVVLENDLKVVKFLFFDDLAKREYVDPNDDLKVIQAPSNDYFSGLALKNNNVINDSYISETLILMGGSLDTRQLSTDDMAAFTTYGIDRIRKFSVRQHGVYDNSMTDIASMILEKAHYDTLDNMADYDNRLVNNKNNHLYFVRGDNKIYGISYYGVQFKEWAENETNRALYETIATVKQREEPLTSIPKYVDTGLEQDVLIEIEIEYYPMSESNAIVHKDDQSGFEQKSVSRLNANDRVNHIDFLGSYSKGLVNAVGGTQISKRGVFRADEPMTSLGTISPNNERVVSITSFEYEDKVEMVVTLVKDYVFISYYIGIDSDRRLQHIPADEFVKRVDRSINVINLDTVKDNFNNSVIEPDLFLNTLTSSGVKSPKYANVNFDGKGVKRITPDVIATGNTIEWYIQALDNFNLLFERHELPNDEGYYQKGYQYSNVFGNVDEVSVKITDMLILGTTYADFTYDLKKDAREQFALNIETTILSKSDQIYVYNGIGKYNNMVNKDGQPILLAVLDYKPNMDDKYVDLGKIKPQINNTTINDGEIAVTLSNSGKGYVWYHMVTRELIAAYIGDVEAGEHKIYYNADTYDTRTKNYVKTGLYTTKKPSILGVEYEQVQSQEYDVYVTIKNNDNDVVDIDINVLGLYDGGQVTESFNAQETKSVLVGWHLGIPQTYIIKAQAQASGKRISKETIAKLEAIERDD